MLRESADKIVHDFIEKGEGVIVYLSGDVVFTRALRNIISRIMGLRGESLMAFSDQASAMSKCLELRDKNIPCVIFVERLLDNRPSTDFIVRLKREYPAIKMIVLTWEATRETVAYFFELGVSRVLVKPASADQVINELAGVIAPPVELHKQFEQCRLHLDNGEYDEALSVADSILMARPDSARALVLQGDALMGLGDADRAVSRYIAAHEAKPIFMAPLSKLAEAFRGMEDERALSYLEQLDEISPLNPERKIDIAEIHLRKGDQECAEEYMDRGVRNAEREVASMVGDLTERIVDAVSAVAPDLAVKYLARVINARRVLGRDDLVHFNRLGIILRGQGRWSEAVDVYRKALLIVPEDPVIHYNMGLAHWEGNERTTALHCFERALSIDSQFYAGSIGAAMNIGTLYVDLRHFSKAVPFFKHILDIDPDHALARRRLTEARHWAARELDHGEESSEKEEKTIFNLDIFTSGGDKKKKKRKPFINLEL